MKTIKEGLEKYITVGVGKKFETIRNYKKWGTDEYSEINHIIG